MARGSICAECDYDKEYGEDGRNNVALEYACDTGLYYVKGSHEMVAPI